MAAAVCAIGVYHTLRVSQTTERVGSYSVIPVGRSCAATQCSFMALNPSRPVLHCMLEQVRQCCDDAIDELAFFGMCSCACDSCKVALSQHDRKYTLSLCVDCKERMNRLAEQSSLMCCLGTVHAGLLALRAYK